MLKPTGLQSYPYCVDDVGKLLADPVSPLKFVCFADLLVSSVLIEARAIAHANCRSDPNATHHS